jgi:DNA mismatch endonuclease (patch repair protein)
MADRITTKQRSLNMSHIRGTDTSIEIMVRRYLFSQGLRYRKNDKRLPGKPDIVLKKYRTAIFVNGCFWHHHKNCKLAYIPKSNTEYWVKKFERNIANDKQHIKELREANYHVITIWECRLQNNFEKEMNRVIVQLNRYFGEDKQKECQK